MKVAALISGGKDSALALYHALDRNYDVKWLVTLIPTREDSWFFHYPNAELTHLFSEASGIPLIRKETSGYKNSELEDLKLLLRNLEVDGLVYGVIASSYQKRGIEKLCGELGITPIAPLWNSDPVEILNSLLEFGFEIIITGVYAYGLTESWLGRRLDLNAVYDLLRLRDLYKISVVGEGGEYETFVLDAPYFKRKVKILDYEKVWRGDSGYLKILSAELVEKE